MEIKYSQTYLIKDFYPEYGQKFLQLNKITQIKNGQYIWKGTSPKDIKMSDKHMKQSMLNITKEMHIKTTMRYHYPPTKVTKMKTNGNTKHWQGYGTTHWWLERKTA